MNKHSNRQLKRYNRDEGKASSFSDSSDSPDDFPQRRMQLYLVRDPSGTYILTLGPEDSPPELSTFEDMSESGPGFFDFFDYSEKAFAFPLLGVESYTLSHLEPGEWCRVGLYSLDEQPSSFDAPDNDDGLEEYKEERYYDFDDPADI